MDPSNIRKVIHDIRNALAAIQGYAQFLQDENTPPEDARQYAAIIADRTTDLNRIVVGLNNLSREFQPYSARPLPFHNLYEKWKQTSCFARSITFFDVIDPKFALPLPADRIKALLNELGSNTQKFCPQPREVSLRADGKCLIWQDNGPGVPPDNLPEIGQPFRSFPNRFCLSPGLGIGLAHCRRLIEEGGGQLTIESNDTGFLVRVDF